MILQGVAADRCSCWVVVLFAIIDHCSFQKAIEYASSERTHFKIERLLIFF